MGAGEGVRWLGAVRAGDREGECAWGSAESEDRDEGEWGGGTERGDGGYGFWGEADGGLFESGNDVVAGGYYFYGDVSCSAFLLLTSLGGGEGLGWLM